MNSNDKRILSQEEMKKAAGGIFPNGEFSPGVNMCPVCGERRNLILTSENVVETFGSASIDAFVPDMTLREYECGNCGRKFLRYGNFYEFVAPAET